MREVRIAKYEDVNALVKINVEIHEIHSKQQPLIFKSDVVEEDVINDFLTAMKDERNKIYILEENTKVIGYCWFRIIQSPETSLFHSTSSLNIVHFGILREFKGLGFGKILMNEIFRISKEHKVNQIIVDAWIFNEEAISFYKSCGFESRNEILWFRENS